MLTSFNQSGGVKLAIFYNFACKELYCLSFNDADGSFCSVATVTMI